MRSWWRKTDRQVHDPYPATWPLRLRSVKFARVISRPYLVNLREPPRLDSRGGSQAVKRRAALKKRLTKTRNRSLCLPIAYPACPAAERVSRNPLKEMVGAVDPGYCAKSS
jgi:hypothetical protein